MKSNKSISIFCNFKNGQKSIFWTEKKLPKMQFHDKKLFIYLISWDFFAWTFLNFMARCGFRVPLLISKKYFFFFGFQNPVLPVILAVYPGYKNKKPKTKFSKPTTKMLCDLIPEDDLLIIIILIGNVVNHHHHSTRNLWL